MLLLITIMGDNNNMDMVIKDMEQINLLTEEGREMMIVLRYVAVAVIAYLNAV